MTKVGPSLQRGSRCYLNKRVWVFFEYDSIQMFAGSHLLLLPTRVHQDNPPNSNQILKGLALKPTITTQQLRFSCWSNGLIQIYPALAGGNPPTDQSPCLPDPDWYSTSCRDFNVIKTSTHCLPFSIIRPTPPPLQGQWWGGSISAPNIA